MSPSVADLLKLDGRVILVTGASGGIGEGIARRLAEAGARVAVHFGQNRVDAERTATAIRDASGEAEVFQGELATGAAELVKAVVDQFGRLDGIVNNAAVQPVSAFDAIAADDLRVMLAINLEAPFALMQAFAAHRRSNGGGGSIVNIGSIEGERPAKGHSHYSISKSALVMATKAAALELGAQGLRVNAVSPGLIHREGIETNWPEGVARWSATAPLGRLGRPDDVADAVLFLLSDAARWITGTNLVVDGGMSVNPGW